MLFALIQIDKQINPALPSDFRGRRILEPLTNNIAQNRKVIFVNFRFLHNERYYFPEVGAFRNLHFKKLNSAQKKRLYSLRTFGSCGKIVSRQKKSRASCIKEYFKVYFHENRMSITQTTEEKMALQNMLIALIQIDTSMFLERVSFIICKMYEK